MLLKHITRFELTISDLYPTICSTTIIIPVLDSNPNDILRCRWANLTGLLGANECQDVCAPDSLTLIDPVLYEDNCTLLVNGSISNTYYAVAIQIEDFFDLNSTLPMSSVPLQFLIYVYATPACPSRPEITGLPVNGSCIPVQVGQPFETQLVAVIGCINTTITDIALLAFSGLIKSDDVTQLSTNTYSVNISWTPSSSQLGSQVLCGIALASNNVQSPTYCFTFFVDLNYTSTCPVSTTTTTRGAGRCRRRKKKEEKCQKKYSLHVDESGVHRAVSGHWMKSYKVYSYSSNSTNTLKSDVDKHGMNSTKLTFSRISHSKLNNDNIVFGHANRRTESQSLKRVSVIRIKRLKSRISSIDNKSNNISTLDQQQVTRPKSKSVVSNARITRVKRSKSSLDTIKTSPLKLYETNVDLSSSLIKNIPDHQQSTGKPRSKSIFSEVNVSRVKRSKPSEDRITCTPTTSQLKMVEINAPKRLDGRSQQQSRMLRSQSIGGNVSVRVVKRSKLNKLDDNPKFSN
ncbi:unnamed protein product [Didymodactylos carnosus]|uniref:Uncharacterized protein n=1 Tax=Didymodactylos carnosus TaxID=1234261 RepID=A0A8S2MET6_9BILA|nr:unnamed protein product [Didymodactylos carnosus]CAF3952521.1 unnamed protein product [Didymodactylos carnosus]